MAGKQWPSDTRGIWVGPNKAYSDKYDIIFNKKKLSVYLAGAMEYAPDFGMDWRRALTPILINMNYIVINPCLTTPHTLSNTKLDKDLDSYRQEIREKIILPDLKLIDGCDLIIVNWDKYVKFGGGTHGELTYALINNIPVYLIESIPREEIPGWILGCTTKTFQSIEELKEFLTNHGYRHSTV